MKREKEETKLTINITKSLLKDFRILMLKMGTNANYFLSKYIKDCIQDFKKKKGYL